MSGFGVTYGRVQAELAAALWRPVSQTLVERAGAHHLDGQPQRRGANPRLLLAGAAAAQAAGHLERRDELLAEVDLDAWGTLGRLWLEGPALGGCPGKRALGDGAELTRWVDAAEAGARWL